MDVEKFRAALAKGSPARLFPATADSRKEERVTSILLAAFSIVPDLAHMVLTEAGVTGVRTSKLHAFTEITFKDDNNKDRPDGLLILTRGKRVWSAVIETKIGTSKLSADQIERYLALAKMQGIDAVITVSNQFAALPTHHPVKVSGHSKRKADLFHFSWLSILSKAVLLIDSKSVADQEQVYVLKELIRYFEHPASGVQCTPQLSPGWKKICEAILHGATPQKTDESANSAIASWHQLQRYLALRLTLAVNDPVTIAMTRQHSLESEKRLVADIDALIQKSMLQASFLVPNAAGAIDIQIDFVRRCLVFKMHIKAPKDVKRATAAINWLLRQLKGCTNDDLHVRAQWPGRAPSTDAPLSLLADSNKLLLPANAKGLPTSFEVFQVVELGVTIKSTRKMVSESEKHLINFYQTGCQHIVKWAPKPPQVEEAKKVEIEELEKNDGIESKPITLLPFWR